MVVERGWNIKLSVREGGHKACDDNKRARTMVVLSTRKVVSPDSTQMDDVSGSLPSKERYSRVSLGKDVSCGMLMVRFSLSFMT